MQKVSTFIKQLLATILILFFIPVFLLYLLVTGKRLFNWR